MRIKPAFVLLALVLFASVAQADRTEWTLDPAHSRFGFSVAHLVVSSVSGRFREATAKIVVDEANLPASQVELVINAASIDTGQPKRDEHLRSPDFFDVKRFPNITFRSTKIVKAGAAYKVTGDLTIRDVTKSITLDTGITHPVKSPWGTQVRAVKATGRIKRGDFGLKWNKALEAGGVLVGEEVTLDIQLELTK